MSIKNLIYIAVIFAGSFIISSCTHYQTGPRIPLRTDAQDIRISVRNLSKSADSIDESLQSLAEMERAEHPCPKLPNPPDPYLIGMAQITSIDWVGPIGPLVDKIAQISHYRVRVLGTPPAIPVVVSITAKDTLLADILRDANFQCGQKANIAVYAANRVIELRYAKF